MTDPKGPMMLSQLAYVVVNSPGGLLWYVLGLILVFAIVWAILRALAAPTALYTALYIVGAIVLLLIVLDAFFGAAPGGAVIVR